MSNFDEFALSMKIVHCSFLKNLGSFSNRNRELKASTKTGFMSLQYSNMEFNTCNPYSPSHIVSKIVPFDELKYGVENVHIELLNSWFISWPWSHLYIPPLILFYITNKNRNYVHVPMLGNINLALHRSIRGISGILICWPDVVIFFPRNSS